MKYPLLILLLASPVHAADAGLKGTWLPVSTVKEGVSEPGKGVKIVIAGDTLEYVYDNGEPGLVYGLTVQRGIR